MDGGLVGGEAAEGVRIEGAELVRLCAADSELFAQAFFPKAFRQKSPPFAREVWAALEDPNVRLLNMLCFRGSAKTTRLRVFAAKRIAYGMSRTVLLVGASERDAIRSVQWLRTQIERNTLFAQTFQLRQGRKWEETQIEIETAFGHVAWVLAAGVTGSIRGINFDDYRPDLIILDDPQTDEMAATKEQRGKVEDLVLGAIANSLASKSEMPNAKLVMLATPQNRDDVTQKALSSSEWKSLVFPCWTEETLHLPVDQQKSSWPERFPDEEFRDKKISHLRQNKLSIFLREFECRVVSPELSAFRAEWLNVRGMDETPRGCVAVLAIDPVPPPSDRQLAKGLTGKDWECHYVWGRFQGEYHLLDVARNRGHEPSWSVSKAFELARRWRVSRIVFDATAYQRTLKFWMEQEMKRRGIYFTVIPIADRMQKYARITSVLGGLATHGKLWIGPEHTEFAAQFEAYPNTEHDDDLDASALALEDLSNPFLEGDNPRLLDYSDVEILPPMRGCP